MMAIQRLQSYLAEQFADALSDVIADERTYRATVRRDALRAMCRGLRDEFAFDYLACLSGVDRGEFVEVVYQLYGIAAKLQAVLRTRAPKDDCRVPSVSEIWHAAQWHERETAEMLGVTFDGHPDPRHLLLPDGWVGYPLRKDYEPTPDYTRPSQLEPEVWAEFEGRVEEEY
jgi:NADH-quinone oxidoreductase subunit C